MSIGKPADQRAIQEFARRRKLYMYRGYLPSLVLFVFALLSALWAATRPQASVLWGSMSFFWPQSLSRMVSLPAPNGIDARCVITPSIILEKVKIYHQTVALIIAPRSLPIGLSMACCELRCEIFVS